MPTLKTLYFQNSKILTVYSASSGSIPTWWDGAILKYLTRSEAAKKLAQLKKLGKVEAFRFEAIEDDEDSAFDRENESRIRQEIY